MTIQRYLPASIVFCSCLAAIFLCINCGKSDEQKWVETYRITIGSHDFTFKQQMLYVLLALELYRLHIGNYPDPNNNLQALIAPPQVLESTGVWRGPYAETDRLFIDPWGRRLSYQVDDNGIAQLSSLGPDGLPGTDDIQARDLFPDIYLELQKLPAFNAMSLPAGPPSSAT